MLKERKVDFQYRDYKREPLSEREIRNLLRLLGVGPTEVLRRNDKAFKALSLTGTESDAKLIGLMAKHPTLLQRPIGIREGRAVLGRPPEALLRLAGESFSHPVDEIQ